MEPSGVDPEITHDLRFEGVEPPTPTGGSGPDGSADPEHSAESSGDGSLPSMTAGEKLAFQMLSASTAPVWLAMILSPNSRFTAWFVRVATPLYAGLGVGYVALLANAISRGGDAKIRLDDPDSLRRAFSDPSAFLAGWTHYLVFDLFVGRHIWQNARAQGKRDRVSLLLTWMAGPAGLTLHMARSARRRRAGS